MDISFFGFTCLYNWYFFVFCGSLSKAVVFIYIHYETQINLSQVTEEGKHSEIKITLCEGGRR